MRNALVTLAVLSSMLSACKSPTDVNADREIIAVTTTDPAALIVENTEAGICSSGKAHEWDLRLTNGSATERLLVNTLRVMDPSGCFTVKKLPPLPLTLAVAGSPDASSILRLVFRSSDTGAFSGELVVNENMKVRFQLHAESRLALDTVLPTPANPSIVGVPSQPLLFGPIVAGEVISRRFIVQNLDVDSWLHLTPGVTGPDVPEFLVYPDEHTGLRDRFLAPYGSPGSRDTLIVGFAPVSSGTRLATLTLGGSATSAMVLNGISYDGRVILVVPDSTTMRLGETITVNAEVKNLSSTESVTINSVYGMPFAPVPGTLNRIDAITLPLVLASGSKAIFQFRYNALSSGTEVLRFDANVTAGSGILEDTHDKRIQLLVMP